MEYIQNDNKCRHHLSVSLSVSYAFDNCLKDLSKGLISSGIERINPIVEIIKYIKHVDLHKRQVDICMIFTVFPKDHELLLFFFILIMAFHLINVNMGHFQQFTVICHCCRTF